MKMICLMTRLALKVFISFNLVLSLCPSKSLSNICSVNSCSFFHSFRIGISYKARKNPALQDSPPAAGQQSCHFPLRRSAILPGGLFYIIGKFGELSYDIKKCKAFIIKKDFTPYFCIYYSVTIYYHLFCHSYSGREFPGK